MRFVFGLLAAVMVAFAAMQYNDPDGPLWAFYYAVPAAWAGIAAFRPRLLGEPLGKAALGITLLAAVALTLWYWPTTAGFWHEEAWRMGKIDPTEAAIAEAAREGMGLMIATAIVLAVFLRGLAAKFSAGHDMPKPSRAPRSMSDRLRS
jgi:hypothetical protein